MISGYMSPEYAMEGIFSVKSDIFSFGVLLLEILSGRKNNSFHQEDGPLSLVGHVSSLVHLIFHALCFSFLFFFHLLTKMKPTQAWELWQRGGALELADQSLKGSFPEQQFLRFTHVGLACVEDCTQDRPNISQVVAMLANESSPLPALKKPAFFVRSRLVVEESQETKSKNCSVNRVTISTVHAR